VVISLTLATVAAGGLARDGLSQTK
jgi:hypothetical protein